MAALHDRRSRLLASLYEQYGEPAAWTPAGGGAAVPCVVRRLGGDDTSFRYGDTEALATRDFVRVMKADVADPEKGSRFAVTETGEELVVHGDPRKSHSGLEWICDVAPARTRL